MTFDAHRLSFGNIAEHYDRARPTYPVEAVMWAVGNDAKRVLDLGSGTGKLTRVALGLGLDVIAVEPDPGMRAQFDAATPGHTALAGSAEEIPLPDGGVDAVIVGQAYHWFTPERALPEIARVLKPGGVFAPMWNMRSTEESWIKRFDEIVDGQNQRSSDSDDADFGPLFTPVEERTFHHSIIYTAQRLRDHAASRSPYLVASPEKQAEILAQVDELTAGFADEFELPYNTLVQRAFKR
ncbi:MAG TPA: class I SAM-dependent methyltransferase [Candidatus Limnocylindrales bacterium]|nr:class I SAM-dependent methyltransferase [Candidatus Limnocylindrales bacterium]